MQLLAPQGGPSDALAHQMGDPPEEMRASKNTRLPKWQTMYFRQHDVKIRSELRVARI
jgi:hypothetical protein